jgi:hypothetical protein
VFAYSLLRGPLCRLGSIASFERCRQVCFTPNYGRIVATSPSHDHKIEIASLR